LMVPVGTAEGVEASAPGANPHSPTWKSGKLIVNRTSSRYDPQIVP